MASSNRGAVIQTYNTSPEKLGRALGQTGSSPETISRLAGDMREQAREIADFIIDKARAA